MNFTTTMYVTIGLAMVVGIGYRVLIWKIKEDKRNRSLMHVRREEEKYRNKQQ